MDGTQILFDARPNTPSEAGPRIAGNNMARNMWERPRGFSDLHVEGLLLIVCSVGPD